MTVGLINQQDAIEIVNSIEAKGITPEQGVNTLIAAIYLVLTANGFSKIEICRRVNDIVMSMTEVPAEPLQ